MIQKNWITAKFLKRYKRFFADVELISSFDVPALQAHFEKSSIQVAHVANTGSLKSVLNQGALCLILPSDNPERKLKFTLEALQVVDTMGRKTWVGINTSYPNQLAQWAFENRFFSHWQDYDQMKPEYKISKETRLDLMLSNSKNGHQHFVEVKNVTLKNENGMAEFPDAVTERGQKHLIELMNLKSQGHTAEILFVIQRSDITGFQPAESIDPEYAKLLKQAQTNGVKVTAVIAQLNAQTNTLQLTRTVEVQF